MSEITDRIKGSRGESGVVATARLLDLLLALSERVDKIDLEKWGLSRRVTDLEEGDK